MFEVSLHQLNGILDDYKVPSKAISFVELQREEKEEGDPKAKELRLIIKAELSNGFSVVIRFKKEQDVSLKLAEKQSQFAVLLKENGIHTPALYKSKNNFANWYSIDEYDVIVMVEEFANGEIRFVDTDIAEKTGMLLAKMHNIAEREEAHVENPVLFDPFTENELFAYSDFQSHAKELMDIDDSFCQGIIKTYNEYEKLLFPIQKEPRYAVQGDISNCNLYQTDKGSLGIFDFNRCGDNNLYCDAIMQGIFEARLMDYPEYYKEQQQEQQILSAFFQGYEMERPFSDMQKYRYPYLYAIINAFWSADIKWKEDSLLKELARGNTKAVQRWIKEIYRRLSSLEPMPSLGSIMK